ncbi:hypothetical protein SAMN06265371_10526 [Lutibacter agarilyticus]|uniref:SnoaL-like domain-containing protein n=1 Tax=Lutibacter agarilyticus TaxID=1109740 RepID=A0A238X7H0_9FLAO|nr:hypothetical protein [Lutibacter agarilyticus]SNR54493.1 hypothetical protein SAMN06265371_10526 [Lutibacter agarilyticus]
MKKTILTLIVGLTLISCSTQNTVKEEGTKVIEKFITAVEDLDIESLENLLDDNYINTGPNFGDSVEKTATLENWKFNIDNLYKSIDFNKSQIVTLQIPKGENKGEWISNLAELNIVYKNGEQACVWTNTIYQIENNKITKSITFYNEGDVYQQLGYMLVKEEIFS